MDTHSRPIVTVSDDEAAQTTALPVVVTTSDRVDQSTTPAGRHALLPPSRPPSLPTAPRRRATGTITNFKDDRGFGFIVEDDENRHDHQEPSKCVIGDSTTATAATHPVIHYVHFADVIMDAAPAGTPPSVRRALPVNARVEFDVTELHGRTRATRVTQIGGAPLPFTESPTFAMIGPSPPSSVSGRGASGVHDDDRHAAAAVASSRLHGVVVNWWDDRGFGFIQQRVVGGASSSAAPLHPAHHHAITTNVTSSSPFSGDLTTPNTYSLPHRSTLALAFHTSLSVDRGNNNNDHSSSNVSSSACVDYYVHFTSLRTYPGAFRSLMRGQHVEFDVAPVTAETPGGINHTGKTQAVNVTSVGGTLLPRWGGPPNRGWGSTAAAAAAAASSRGGNAAAYQQQSFPHHRTTGQSGGGVGGGQGGGAVQPYHPQPFRFHPQETIAEGGGASIPSPYGHHPSNGGGFGSRPSGGVQRGAQDGEGLPLPHGGAMSSSSPYYAASPEPRQYSIGVHGTVVPSAHFASQAGGGGTNYGWAAAGGRH